MWARHQAALCFDERPPFLPFLHVLHDDYVRLRTLGPQNDHPRQVTDIALDRLAALGLAEMFAVW